MSPKIEETRAMAELTTIRELFDIPEQIRKGDFVLKLAEGVANPKDTARTYVVTPGLVRAFDQALGLVGSALRDGRSQAAYLHGSFGSGKSHFMAMLSLLLAGNEDAWRLPELHELRGKHGFVGTKKLLELQFHMIGQQSIEGAIFSGYIAHVRAKHPDAPLPGLFADEGLFENAERMRATLGDEAFFAPMNQGGRADAGWGDVGTRWDRERFEAAMRSGDTEVRAELFTALVQSHFAGWDKESRRYVDTDEGLATIARHASKLGYDGIVLFLDELILWLSGRGSDPAWLHREVEKMIKLVEAANMHRDIPLVSFIARQRNLAEMVGEDYAGVENLRLHHSLKHWEGRYDTVTLEDANLPAIVEKRILKPKSDDAKGALKKAFETMRKSAGSAWNTLLAHEDQAAFEKLYPFSPALVECLVALSNSLQRQRTAIKLLMEILVEHTTDLQVGEVVRVGDLFDVLASGQDSADGIMRSRFEAAKQIYKYQFLPLLQRSNGTTTEARCQRMRADHPARLGCSGCAERACRSDNRLVKTLLVSALVPEVDAVKELSASKLVQLNHGSLKVPLPGTEATLVAQKLRSWAAEIGQLSVGTENDPRVRLRLEGVDLAPILERARGVDSAGGRQALLGKLVFAALGLDKMLGKDKPHSVEWRGTSRSGRVIFGNVRTMSHDYLRCAEDEDWRLVIDYPFDDGQFGPNDDHVALDRFVEAGNGSWTLAWLPSFLSDAMEKLLGELVILEHICETRDTMRKYVNDLSPDNQTRAMTDLENLRVSKEARLLGVLQEAYGLASPKEGNLDTARLAETHIRLLKAGAKVAARVPPNFAEAVETYVHDLLAARWPRHPKLGEKLTKRRVEHLVEVFGQIIDDGDKRLPAERALIEEARDTLGELGLVRVTENAIHLLEDRLMDLEKRREQKTVDSPTVSQLRGWIDDTGRLGLQTEAEDLIIRCYARWSARTFVAWGKAHTVEAGKPIPDDVILEKPPLPAPATWVKGIETAGRVLGIALPGKARHADNLKRFEALVAAKVEEHARGAEQLPGELERWASLLGVAQDADRLKTARSARDLMAALKQGHVVEVLAAYEPETSASAVARSIERTKANVAVLGERLVYGQLEAVAGRRELEGAVELIEKAATALRQDEAIEALAEKLRRLAEEAQRLLAPPPPPKGKEILRRTVHAKGAAAARAELARLTAEVEAAIEKAGDGAELSGTVVVVATPKGKV
jgi:hypothetical protein